MSANQIQIISSSTIKVDSTARINLTPWDLELLFLEYTEMGLLFFKPNNTITTPSLILHLKSSLHRALQFFPPLAGRLAAAKSADGAATSFSIDCREGEALFIHATVDDKHNLTVADILDSSPPPHVREIVQSFFPLTGVRNSDGGSQPLLAVQVTELVDGLFIGWSANHLVGDGTSFWHFFNSWAEISRGEIPINNPISKLPFLKRDQVTLDFTGSKNIYIHNEHLILDNNPVTKSPPLLRERVFHLTRENIAKLKTRANKEMAESEGKISSLQAVVAHLWRSIIRCRFDTINSLSTDQQTTSFEIPMNSRPRLDPPLPEEYFGNAVFPGIVTLEVGKILENSVGWIAWQINRMVAMNNSHDKVKEFYMSWIKKPTFLQSVGLPRNYFVVVNSPRFSVYGNDFGWGKPVAARCGRSDSFDGRVTISGGLEEGSLEIAVCLFSETLSKLEEDKEFMEFVILKC